MATHGKPPLAPRLVVLAGVGLNAIVIFGGLDAPGLLLVGSATAIAGLIWFLVAFWRSRKSGA